MTEGVDRNGIHRTSNKQANADKSSNTCKALRRIEKEMGLNRQLVLRHVKSASHRRKQKTHEDKMKWNAED